MQTIVLKDISKNYRMGGTTVRALREVSLEIADGEFVAIMGASGSGKSTLMNILGCLDRASAGDYMFEGTHVTQLSPAELADIRNQKIGFIFQGFNLLARTTALENVELPLMYDRTGRIADPGAGAIEALETVGLGDRIHHEPAQLSGGQQQRVAIARALVNRPSILLADEPTGNLDSAAGRQVMDLLEAMNGDGLTLIVVTHDPGVACRANRALVLRDGRIVQRVSGTELARISTLAPQPESTD
jgi:putative ABC transport system ATP-binding protein